MKFVKMRFIINSNRVMAALIREASSRYVLFFPNFDFYAPDFLLVELEKHKDEIREKTKLTPNQFEIIFNDAKTKVHMVPLSEYQDKIAEAEKIMEKIDIKDSAFIAVSIALKIEGIWTEDSHFTKQKICKMYSTHDLIQLIQQS
jgi:predicted nucleic acid-binding protein